ncbi:MAG: type II toxin-antitoxin system death-on-curing family toxin [Chloroflexi bacterium]|nr:type II toxin-antitoxin system death-on-curing family toxin [Chloroflexota bacterium]
METTREPIKFLTEADICSINTDIIASFGGWQPTIPNLRAGASLDYILAVIGSPIHGVDPYPTIVDKAAALAWYIITRHPFHNTNKRTAVEAAIEFLELNGVVTEFEPEDVVQTTVGVQTGMINYRQFRDWIASNIRQEPNSN